MMIAPATTSPTVMPMIVPLHALRVCHRFHLKLEDINPLLCHIGWMYELDHLSRKSDEQDEQYKKAGRKQHVIH
jgi:hypothetical protein